MLAIFKHRFIDKPDFLYAGDSPIHGLGVFTQKVLRPGELIEKAPLILIAKADSELLSDSILYDYYFMVKDERNPVAIGLGYSSLYNHASPSNAGYSISLRHELIIIRANRFIDAGEEITINYHGRPTDPRPVSFTKPRNP